jgi:nickel-dependent lactate racemase
MPERTEALIFGEGAVEVRLPDRVRTMETEELPALPDHEDAIWRALSVPIESPPLASLARGKKSACIVISDITRPVPNRVILPPLLKTIEKAGIGREAITILIANGMHRPNLGQELASMVGDEIMDRYRIVNHRCREPGDYCKVAEIEDAPIEINRHYLDADLKILTGLIEPHFYAGYSGGRKSILPGISSFETMKFMHSYRMIDHPNVTNCLLEGNPFHEYGLRVAEWVGVDFILNVVINRDREISGVFAGHCNHAHVAGCDRVARHALVRLDARAEMVVTSGGGYPLDATFYQISKALICAMDILKKGGTIVVACECREGLGNPEFCDILRSVCGHGEFCERFSDPGNFVIDQWCAQNIYRVMDHAGAVYVYSPGLTREDLNQLGAIKIDGIQQTLDQLLPSHNRVIVAPEGPYVVGRVGGR